MNSHLDLGRFGQTLAREAPDAIIYADAEGLIRFWNRSAERIFGFEEREALGKSLDIVIPENLRQRHWDGYAETMRSGKTRNGAGDILAVPALRKDGTRVSIEFTIVPFRDSAGRMVGIAAILRDVTKRFEEMKALRQQLAERGHAEGGSGIERRSQRTAAGSPPGDIGPAGDLDLARANILRGAAGRRVRS